MCTCLCIYNHTCTHVCIYVPWCTHMYMCRQHIVSSWIMLFFLVCIKGIMLVYDITNEKSFENIRNWIRNIEEVSQVSIDIFIPCEAWYILLHAWCRNTICLTCLKIIIYSQWSYKATLSVKEMGYYKRFGQKKNHTYVYTSEIWPLTSELLRRPL
jgi:hypothetical protein